MSTLPVSALSPRSRTADSQAARQSSADNLTLVVLFGLGFGALQGPRSSLEGIEKGGVGVRPHDTGRQEHPIGSPLPNWLTIMAFHTGSIKRATLAGHVRPRAAAADRHIALHRFAKRSAGQPEHHQRVGPGPDSVSLS